MVFDRQGLKKLKIEPVLLSLRITIAGILIGRQRTQCHRHGGRFLRSF